MKRIAYFGLSIILMAALMTAMAVAQQSSSLGDYARAVRKDKAQKPPATKQFDNDNLPTNDKISVVGQAASTDANKPADAAQADTAQAGAAQASADQQKDAAKDGQKDEAADRQAKYQGWQKKIKEQKDAIDLLARELDVLQREYRIRAAAMYGDVGNRLRNAASWDKEDADYKQKIAAKQKAVDDAKQQLDNMQEEARKAGVPSSMRE